MSTQTPRKRLPENPSEENLRKQAKQVAKAEGLQLAAAQRRLANDYGFHNWAELMEAAGHAHRIVPMLPLRELVTFPHETYPIYIGRPQSIRAIEAAANERTPILMVAQKDAVLAMPSAADMYEIGTLGTLSQWLKLGDGTIKAEVVGTHRARASRFIFDQDYFKAEYEVISEATEDSAELQSLMRSVIEAFDAYIVHEGRLPLETAKAINSSLIALTDPNALADKMIGHIKLPIAERQAFLEKLNPAERLQRLLKYLKD